MSSVPLPRLFKTASFRFATLYAVLFGGSVLVLGVIAFWSTRAALNEQVARRVEAETALLEKEFATGGLDRLIATIQDRSRGEGNLDYFLIDPAGKRLAGNLPPSSGRPGWVEIDAGRDAAGEQSGESERVRTLIKEFDGGLRLGVGEDLEEVAEMEGSFLFVLASALGIILVLGIGGGLLLGAAFLRRIDAITQTAEAIIAGDLSRRIEDTGMGDDFDRLSATLNTMLDRITGLMENLRQVSNDIAHDLRTPLSRLRQHLEEVRQKRSTADDYKEVVERAIEEADALLGTFSALLRIAQIEAGTSRSLFQTVDLSDVLRTVAEAYTPDAENGGRGLRTSIEEGVQINGDRELLSQLFANLVENTLHHTPPGTQILLRLARGSNGGVLAEVADDGPGIPDEERTNVFRRFYRLDRSRTSPGNGLGLSMVAVIADLHQAKIELVDNQPGLRIRLIFT